MVKRREPEDIFEPLRQLGLSRAVKQRNLAESEHAYMQSRRKRQYSPHPVAATLASLEPRMSESRCSGYSRPIATAP